MRQGGLNVVMWLCAAFLLTGCGPQAPQVSRSIVSGKVAYAGKPVATGQIRFLAAGGPPSQGQITGGTYRIDYKGGVPVGECRVEIDAYEETGAEIAIGAGGRTAKETVQVLPAKYNAQSELKVQISASPENTHDFDLSE